MSLRIIQVGEAMEMKGLANSHLEFGLLTALYFSCAVDFSSSAVILQCLIS